MSDSVTHYHECIEEYEELCKHYGEKPVRKGVYSDPFSSHAKELKLRYQRDKERKVNYGR
jgi:hypothetical protein